MKRLGGEGPGGETSCYQVRPIKKIPVFSVPRPTLKTKLFFSKKKEIRFFCITNMTVRVFTGSDLITGSDRIGPDRARNWLVSSFLKHFFIIIIMFIKYVYDHNNDVWIIKVG